MFCKHCGYTLPPDAFFCPNCGRKVETPLNTPGANVSGQTRHVADGRPNEIKSGMNFALAITVLAMFGCGYPLNLVFGIAAVINAYNADRNLESGDFEKAKGYAKTAKTLCLISVAVIGFGIFFSFLICALLACLDLPCR